MAKLPKRLFLIEYDDGLGAGMYDVVDTKDDLDSMIMEGNHVIEYAIIRRGVVKDVEKKLTIVWKGDKNA